MSSFDQGLAQQLSETRAAGLGRSLRRLTQSSGREATWEGQALVNFASNDYLGLAQHASVVDAAARSARDWGAGSAASRLLGGSLAIHHQLEEALAAWKGVEGALVFSSGYAAALGAIPALVGPNDVVLLDKKVHACCVDAARLSGAKVRVGRHNDLAHWESLLQWASQYTGAPRSGRILIVTESVFSMDGDSPPLAELVELKDRFGAWLMLDEAHAAGLHGTGRSGLAEATGLSQRIEVHLGTLGKALGSVGGYIAGSRTLIDYLINHARSFIFSTAPAPAASGAARAALEIIRADEGQRRCERLWTLVERLCSALGRPPHGSAILPIVVGAESAAVAAADQLRARGLWTPAIRFPTVARGQARLRVTLTAAHTDDDIARLAAGLQEFARGAA